MKSITITIPLSKSVKLTIDQVSEIRKQCLTKSTTELSKEFGVSVSNIQQIKYNRIWHDPNYQPPALNRDSDNLALNIMCVYRIRCLPTAEEYIGSTTCFKKRRWTHRHYLRYRKHKSFKLQAVWDKFGRDNFVFEILEVVSQKSLLRIREQHWMDQSKTLLNSAPYSDTLKGVIHSSKSRRNMVEAQRRVGYRGTPESNARGAAKRRGRKMPLSAVEKAYKPILQYSTDGTLVKEWPNIKSAAAALKVNYTSIVNACRGRKRSIRGFIWKYKYEQQILQRHKAPTGN